MRGNIIVIDDGGGGSSKNGKKTQTTTSTPATTQTWQTKPTAQARGNRHVVQVEDGGGYGGATAQSTQPFRNPLALGGPNPSATMQRLNRITAAVEQTRAELVAAKRGERQTSYRPHGDNSAYREARRETAAARNSVDALNKEIENITGVSGSERLGLALGGETQRTAAGVANLGGLFAENAAPGNRRIQQSRAEVGSAFGDGFWSTAAQMLINNPSSGSASADFLRNNVLTAIDDRHVPQIYETASRMDQSGKRQIERAKTGLDERGRAAVDFVVSVPEMAAEVGMDALLPGAGTALRGINAAGQASLDYRQRSGEDYDSGKALLRAGLAGGGVALGTAASKAVGRAGSELLRDFGWQDDMIPNAINRGVGAGTYAVGEVGGDELGRALTEDGYTLDKGRIVNSGLSAFTFSALDGLAQGMLASARDKARIQSDIADVWESYEAMTRALRDPNATAEQRAQLAQQTIDRANWASRQMDEIGSFGARREIEKAQGMLGDIIEGVRPYAALEAVTQPTDPFSITDTSFTNTYGYGTMQARGLEPQELYYMPHYSEAITPKEKFVKYSLDYSNENAAGKAEAYERGLGFTKDNADSLIEQIHNAVSEGKVSPYAISKTEYGTKYKFRIPILGPNGNVKNVIAIYQIDNGASVPRLITNYLEGK